MTRSTPRPTRRQLLGTAAGLGLGAVLAVDRAGPAAGVPIEPAESGSSQWLPSYTDGRPVATLRLDAEDAGPVLRHGDGPDNCDRYGARDIWVYKDRGTLYMNYDGAGDDGWLACLATSTDGRTWTKHGPVLHLGEDGAKDSASASYGTTFRAGNGDWHMFYLGTPNTSPPPDRIPAFPYYTMKAHGPGPAGPWTKQEDVVPFSPEPGTFDSTTASPGQVVPYQSGYLQFFSASSPGDHGTLRTIGLARTDDLDGAWAVDPEPILPLSEQIENASLHYEPSNETWFLFTNHVAADSYGEYTDAIWVYWSKDLTSWDPQNKAVVLDRTNCSWSPNVIGLPSVVQFRDKLAVYYDARPYPDASHMGRDVGLAWLPLPLAPPQAPEGTDYAQGAVVSASSSDGEYSAQRAVDGRTSTELGAPYSWCNVGVEGEWPAWLEVDLGRKRAIRRIELYTTSGYELRDYRIQVRTGSKWHDLVSVVENRSAYRVHHIEAHTGRYFRVLCTSGPDRQTTYMRINELRLWG